MAGERHGHGMLCESAFRGVLTQNQTYSARMRTIVTAALQRQYSQTEFIFWITVVSLFISEYYCLLMGIS
jgi:general stress protein CsbA